MTVISFADVVHPAIQFSSDRADEKLVLDLVDTPWFQRLRDISQTANTRLVYPTSEHSRFPHCLGVAYLAKSVLEKLESSPTGDSSVDIIKQYRAAVLVAALLHDIGHLAPGSHTAFKTWFPGQEDSHESLAEQVISFDPTIGRILNSHSRDLQNQVLNILAESDSIPPWTWQLISGGGWNVDRGNWLTLDSIMAGVEYGKYNIPALVDSITITQDGHLALTENRIDAMVHFMVSRAALYNQIYQHRVLLAADTLNKAVVDRARDLGADTLPFADQTMRSALTAKTVGDLSLDTIFKIRESWWKYHLLRWTESNDKILRDLSHRIINRKLFKTIKVDKREQRAELLDKAENGVRSLGLDPRYYLHEISTLDVQTGDLKQSMLIRLSNGSTTTLAEANPLIKAMLQAKIAQTSWIALPEEAKNIITTKEGRTSKTLPERVA